ESPGKEAVKAALAKPSPDRLLLIAQAYRHGLTTGEIHAACHYDSWFLERIGEIVAAEEQVRRSGLPYNPTAFLRLKQMGFSDPLYFEPLTAEDVIEIVRVEQRHGRLLGVIVQFGGQTPLNLAKALERAEVPILGTSPDAIDLAEDRERFQKLLRHLGLRQPDNGTAYSPAEAEEIAQRIGYPVVIRPSYVLGGRAMEIVHDNAGLSRYIRRAVIVSGTSPVLIDRYLQNAIGVEVDAVADGAEVYVAGI